EQKPEGVRADAEERGVPERRVAGEPADEVPGTGQHRRDKHEDEQVEHPVRQPGQRQGEQHHEEDGSLGGTHIAPRPTVPKSPRGRTSSTRMRMTKNVISDQAGDTVEATTADEVDTMTAPTTAPPTLPSPPSTTIDSSREMRS